MLVLAMLGERESYGYELVGRLAEAGLTGIATGTVYPVLSRLERDGLIASRLVASPSGPARKYYRPTSSGNAGLRASTAEWDDLVAVVRRVLSADLAPTDPHTPTDPQE